MAQQQQSSTHEWASDHVQRASAASMHACRRACRGTHNAVYHYFVLVLAGTGRASRGCCLAARRRSPCVFGPVLSALTTHPPCCICHSWTSSVPCTPPSLQLCDAAVQQHPGTQLVFQRPLCPPIWGGLGCRPAGPGRPAAAWSAPSALAASFRCGGGSPAACVRKFCSGQAARVCAPSALLRPGSRTQSAPSVPSDAVEAPRTRCVPAGDWPPSMAAEPRAKRATKPPAWLAESVVDPAAVEPTG